MSKNIYESKLDGRSRLHRSINACPEVEESRQKILDVGKRKQSYKYRSSALLNVFHGRFSSLFTKEIQSSPFLMNLII